MPRDTKRGTYEKKCKSSTSAELRKLMEAKKALKIKIQKLKQKTAILRENRRAREFVIKQLKLKERRLQQTLKEFEAANNNNK